MPKLSDLFEGAQARTGEVGEAKLSILSSSFLP